MIGRLAYVRERLETSIWLLPLGFCLVSIVLGFFMLWLDRQVDSRSMGLLVFAMPVDSARQVLGVIAGSVITVGGVAFSITMVALTLTSGQYGPKIVRHFLEDNDSKISLGLFLGTYIYTLIVLTGYVQSDRPHITVLAALLFALVALVGFARFIHRTATDLQADEIIQRIGARLRKALDELVQEDALAGRTADTLLWRRAARPFSPRLVAAHNSGYVQTVDYAGLVRWCLDHDCLLEARARAGHFIVEGKCLFKIYGRVNKPPEDVAGELNSLVVTGPIRTPVQDPEYPITQLNQLAARALSPGINDPGTAITCIDWFSLSLANVVDRDLPGCVFLDAGGRPRLLATFTHFAGIAKATYAQLRHLARSELSVTVSLMESLCRLAELTGREDRLSILAEHGQLIWEAVDTRALAAYDLTDLRQRYRKLIALTGRCTD